MLKLSKVANRDRMLLYSEPVRREIGVMSQHSPARSTDLPREKGDCVPKLLHELANIWC